MQKILVPSALLLLLVGCGADLNPYFDPVYRVLAITADDPSPAPGQTVNLEFYLLDPESSLAGVEPSITLDTPPNAPAALSTALLSQFSLQDATTGASALSNPGAKAVRKLLTFPPDYTLLKQVSAKIESAELPLYFKITTPGRNVLYAQKVFDISADNANPSLAIAEPASITPPLSVPKDGLPFKITLSDSDSDPLKLIVRWETTFGQMDPPSATETTYKAKDKHRDKPADGKAFLYVICSDKHGGELLKEIQVKIP